MPGRLLLAVVSSTVLARLPMVIAAVAAVVVVVVAVAVAAVAVAITVFPSVGPHALLPLTESITIVVEHTQIRVEDAGGVGER